MTVFVVYSINGSEVKIEGLYTSLYKANVASEELMNKNIGNKDYEVRAENHDIDE